MPTRTSKKIVTFRKPFVLSGFDEVIPAGAYSVETDEELLEDISFPVYRRKLTLLHLGAKPGCPGVTRTLTIDPNVLDAALKRDQVPSEFSDGWNRTQKMRTETAEMQQNDFDRQAIERGEEEGMIVRST